MARPSPEHGLLQRLDENEVSAILPRAARGVSSSQPLYEALASPRMNRSPWARGYRRHTWKLGEKGNYVDVTPWWPGCAGRPSVRMRKRYRFGRPPEEAPRPWPTGPELPPEVLHGSR